MFHNKKNSIEMAGSNYKTEKPNGAKCKQQVNLSKGYMLFL